MSKENRQFTMRWAGSYTFISCSYWATHYSSVLKRLLGKGFDATVFIHKKGVVSFYVDKDELHSLGTHLASMVKKDESSSLELLDKLKQNTSLLMGMMDELDGKIPSSSEYSMFLSAFERHLAYHVFMKKTVDFLSQKDLDRLMPRFKEARIYSEKVYSRTESFFRSLAAAIAKKEKHDAFLLTCLSQHDLESYLAKGVLPSRSELQKRFNLSAIVFSDDALKIFLGKDAEKIESDITSINGSAAIKGISACNGKVKGTVRIVLDPLKKHTFNKGDILVTGMTRPEYMPYIAKASAVITDAGGILCHAAITAREMKIPTIVGTEKATKVLKDGDKVEVDATNGKIKKI